MNIGEGMCYGECCEVCKPGDSQTCTPGAHNTLYVNKKILKRDRQFGMHKFCLIRFKRKCRNPEKIKQQLLEPPLILLRINFQVPKIMWA